MPPQWRGVIEEYREYLPVSQATPIVTLREGGTPVVRSESLSAATHCDVYLKFEGSNPTGSFKDRGMTLAISKAVEEGARAVVCASTGNTSASASAYAARLPLVPSIRALFQDLRDEGFPVCVAGSGPALVAFEPEGGRVWDLGPGWRVLRPGVDRTGATVGED
jgi:hypothetical protein